MKEILIVMLSALLGYIVLSAFSLSSTPEEAMKRILEQPHTKSIEEQQLNKERIEKEQEIKLAQLENEKIKAELAAQQAMAMNQSNNDAQVKTAEITKIGMIEKEQIKKEILTTQKESDNKMLIIISLLIFILIYVYLRYQKNLAQIELEREREQNNLLAKKEYAERILSIVATGNVSIETEHKLLRILDELNSPQVQPINQANMLHPNPDIEQLEFRKTI
jgi:uncharacterized membrane protein YidH (DUF202 family)